MRSYEPINSQEVLIITTFKEELNTEKAIEKLGIPRATALTSLRRFQEKIRIKNFDIHKNGNVEITDDGKAVIEDICKIAGGFDKFYNNIGCAYQTSFSGDIHLSSTQTLLECFFAPYISAFTEKNREIHFHIHQIDSFFHPNQRYSEFFLCPLTSEDDISNYEYIPFHKFQQKLWASEGFLKKNGPIYSLKDVSGKNIIFLNSAFPESALFGSSDLKYTVAKNIQNLKMGLYQITR